MQAVEVWDIKTREAKSYEPDSVPAMIKRCLDRCSDPEQCMYRAEQALLIYSYTNPQGEYVVDFDLNGMPHKDVLWLLKVAEQRLWAVVGYQKEPA